MRKGRDSFAFANRHFNHLRKGQTAKIKFPEKFLSLAPQLLMKIPT
jgi:hypothetical protein